MKNTKLAWTASTLLLAVSLASPASLRAASAQILGWNNLGMHCMDSDYSVFSILPPYNTIEAQLIVGGRLVTASNGYTLTYQAVADPDGSFNSTAMGKGNYYTYATALYGAVLAPEGGLAGWSMPGLGNVPQGMRFEQTNYPASIAYAPVNWFRAEGIPISPYDDAGRKNPYPLMRIIARNAASQPIATNDVVLPVSDEMDCRACHASGTQTAARPAAGWVWDGFPERDFRLNILRLHDEREFALHPGLYGAALAAKGFNPHGLYRGVTADGKPVLCAACHASEALGTGSYSNIPPLTASVHAHHASVIDPLSHAPLDNAASREACYRCHPGSTTRCLRGAMGGAIAMDGSMEMQCQSCHGNMSQVGLSSRVGWFMEPTCQSCHTGTATHNNGQIRYTSSFTDTNTWTVRTAADQTFATKTNTPALTITNFTLSLYRFSAGHGGLQCSACHGSTHAEFPSTHRNDNLRNERIQTHGGVMIECTACHATLPRTANGGPHGMHPIDQGWITGTDALPKHADWMSSVGGKTACAPCHGADYRGTVLSRAKADRSFQMSDDGNNFTLNLFRGADVGCYNCHNGPDEGDFNPSAAPTVSHVAGNTTSGQSVALPVAITPVAATLRVIVQPAHGSAGVSNRAVVYFPDPGYVGGDSFAYAAYDGMKNSTLGTATVAVAQGPFSIAAVAQVPPSYPAQWPVAFGVVATPSNIAATVTYDWNFGDGSTHDTNHHTVHTYSNPGRYTWTVVSSVPGASATCSGEIEVGSPIWLGIASVAGPSAILTWPLTIADTLLEESLAVGPDAHWFWVTNPVSPGLGGLQATVPQASRAFFRVRQPW